jgi:uncharacterized membrane protein
MIGSFDALIAATVLFVAGHFLLSGRAPRRAMTEFLGPQGYRIAYSVVALAAFVWMLRGYAAAPVVVLWDPPVQFGAPRSWAARRCCPIPACTTWHPASSA